MKFMFTNYPLPLSRITTAAKKCTFQGCDAGIQILGHGVCNLYSRPQPTVVVAATSHYTPREHTHHHHQTTPYQTREQPDAAKHASTTLFCSTHCCKSTKLALLHSTWYSAAYSTNIVTIVNIYYTSYRTCPCQQQTDHPPSAGALTLTQGALTHRIRHKRIGTACTLISHTTTTNALRCETLRAVFRHGARDTHMVVVQLQYAPPQQTILMKSNGSHFPRTLCHQQCGVIQK